MFLKSDILKTSSFKISKNYFILFLKIITRKQTSESIKLLTANIKPMNPIQKYSHIFDLSACILNMFVLMFLCPINLLISVGMCSTHIRVSK